MSTPENAGSDPFDYPIEETAPTLDMYCAEDRYQPVHVSNLTPDPSAEVDLKLWARLHYQIRELRLYDDTYPHGVTPELSISANFPASGVFIPNRGTVTWVELAIAGRLRGDGEVIEGWRSSYIELDLKKPGVVEVTDTYIAFPEAMPGTTTLEAAKTLEDTEGLYMADDGSSIAFKQQKYILGNEGAERLIELLRSAKPLDGDPGIATQRWTKSLAEMEIGLREACHRYYVLGKNLLREPEEAFREEQWEWEVPPAGGFYRRFLYDIKALGVLKPDTYVVYAPPAYEPREAWSENSYNDQGQRLAWSKATWDEKKLPDGYNPEYDAPTDVHDITIEEVLAEIPAEKHDLFARSHATWLFSLADTVRGGDGRPENIVSEQEYKELVGEYISALPDFARDNPPSRYKHWTEIFNTTEETFERDFAIFDEPTDSPDQENE